MNFNNLIPPELAQRFLRWFLREDIAEEVQGDMEEQFYAMLEKVSPRKAKLNYWYQVFNYLRPFALGKLKVYHPNHYAMFKNYFKVGWRNLTKQKMYSAIKIGGLAFGIAACLLIALYIQDELSYDKQLPAADRIYRVVAVYNVKGENFKGIHFPAPMATALKSDFPEVETTARFLSSELFGAGSKEVRRDDKVENIYEEGFIFADQELLEIFQPHFVHGNISHALDEPNTIAISKSKADKYFPEEDPLGKTLILNNDETNPYKIGGVFEDFPTTSHFRYDFLMTMTGIELWPGEQTYWGANNYYTYIKAIPGTDAMQLASKITEDIVKNYFLPSMKERGRADAEEIADNFSIDLQPVLDTHLKSAEIHDGLHHGDIRFVWLFGAIASFILIIACINFINLSTAKSANRAKEVGLRKVMGSFRINLINQFLTESLIYSFLSFVLALLLAWVLLPYFNELSAKSLVFPWKQWWLLPIVVASSVVVGIIAGLYPSFYLSSFKPMQVLKGSLNQGSKSSKMRSALVIFQFTTSIVLIISTFIIYRQMNFILDKDLGYDKEQVLLLQGANTMGAQLPAFKNELLTLSEVKSVSVSDYLPIRGTKRNQNGFWNKGKVNEESSVGAQIWRVDHDYIKTMGMHIIEGRDFNYTMASDSQAVVINKAMSKELNLENPIGKEITNGRDLWQVIGVVEDFNFESLKENIEPLCLVVGNTFSVVSVKINPTDMPHFMETITSLWDRFSPNQAMRYTFLDESFARMYDDVQRMGRIFTSFAILAIIVACFGLFALSAFMVEQRSKEISIRLVLGASLNSIFRLLTQNFLLLVFVSFVIAVPLAWYMMQKWLADYEYKVQIGWDVFLLAGLLAVMIAILTISYQSIRAALMNPVDNLRGE